MKDAPQVLANEGQRFFVDNFRKEAWEGKRWKGRSSKSKNKNPLLVGRTRQLKNAVNRSIKEANKNRIKWGVYLSYAATHNYGFNGVEHVRPHKRRRFGKSKVADITKMNVKTRKYATRTVKVQTGRINVKGFSRKMNIPKRQFMGASKTLRNRLLNKLTQMFKNRIR